jgi:hypothetical protein
MTVAVNKKRIRSEDCEVLRVASLRTWVQPHDDEVVLGDGTRLDLHRAQVRGVFAAGGTRGTATTLMAYCPSCGTTARVLRKPFSLQRWGCRRCLDLIYPAQRRSGWHKGRIKHKPKTWRLSAICTEQRRIARLLGLQCWPPAQMNWGASDLAPKRHLNQTRIDALLTRLDALENIRVMSCATAMRRALGIEAISSWDGHTNALESLLLSTKWAMYEHWRQPTTTFKPTDKIKFLRLRHHPTQPHHHH